jgi:hypothetical protein
VDKNGFLTGKGFLDVPPEGAKEAQQLTIVLNFNYSFHNKTPIGYSVAELQGKKWVVAKYTPLLHITVLGLRDPHYDEEDDKITNRVEIGPETFT